MELKIMAQDFDRVVLENEKPVMVDFFATWCGPCKMMGPVVEKLAEQLDGKAVVVKLDVDEAEDIAERYKIMSVPSFLFFNRGEVVDTVVGGTSIKDLSDRIKPYI